MVPLWSLGLNGSGVVLATADSGLDLDHTCFRNGTTEVGVRALIIGKSSS